MSSVYDPRMYNGWAEAKPIEVLVDCLNSIIPSLNLPLNASEEDLRDCLFDGTVSCRILSRLRPGFVGDSVHFSELRLDRVNRFSVALEEMGLPKFHISDLEKGSMETVLETLSSLRAQSMLIVGGNNSPTVDPISRT